MFPPQIKSGENPLLVLPRCAVSRYEIRRITVTMRFRYDAGSSRERVPRHANGRGNKARGAILVISYLNLNTVPAIRRRRLNAGRHYGLCLPACLPACRATLSPGQKPAIIHCPLRRTVVARVGCTDDFLPALRALLLPGTALSTPVHVGADGS